MIAAKFTIAIPLAVLPLLLFSLMATTPAEATSIDLGLAGQYAVFGLGSTQDVGTADSVLVNTGAIYSTLAVGADTTSVNADGNGTFQKGFITGDLVVDGTDTSAIILRRRA